MKNSITRKLDRRDLYCILNFNVSLCFAHINLNSGLNLYPNTDISIQ